MLYTNHFLMELFHRTFLVPLCYHKSNSGFMNAWYGIICDHFFHNLTMQQRRVALYYRDISYVANRFFPSPARSPALPWLIMMLLAMYNTSYMDPSKCIFLFFLTPISLLYVDGFIVKRSQKLCHESRFGLY